MRSYLTASNATRLSELTAFELKRFLGELRDRGSRAEHDALTMSELFRRVRHRPSIGKD